MATTGRKVSQRSKPASRGGATVRLNGKPPSAGLKFPIGSKAQAKVALARINQAKPALTASQKAAVRARARTVLGHSTPATKRK